MASSPGAQADLDASLGQLCHHSHAPISGAHFLPFPACRRSLHPSKPGANNIPVLFSNTPESELAPLPSRSYYNVCIRHISVLAPDTKYCIYFQAWLPHHILENVSCLIHLLLPQYLPSDSAAQKTLIQWLVAKLSRECIIESELTGPIGHLIPPSMRSINPPPTMSPKKIIIWTLPKQSK